MRFLAIFTICMAFGVRAAAANDTTRIFLFTPAAPPGVDPQGTARRLDTMADIRSILSKNPRVVLTNDPDEAEVSIQVSACRLTRRIDHHLVPTVDLVVSAGVVRGTVQGTATRVVSQWRDAANRAVESAYRWIEEHATASGRLSIPR